MSYTKTTWATNDIITPERLNNLEDGIKTANEGDVGIVHRIYDSSNYKLDKNYTEIVDMMNNKSIVIIKYENNYFYDIITNAEYSNGYSIYVSNLFGHYDEYGSTTPDGVLTLKQQY